MIMKEGAFLEAESLPKIIRKNYEKILANKSILVYTKYCCGIDSYEA